MKYEQKGSNIYEMTVRHADTGFARYSKWFQKNYNPGVNPVKLCFSLLTNSSC